MRSGRFSTVWPPLRRAVALVALALLIPLAGSGALLVWQPEIARLLHPAHTAPAVAIRLAPDRYATAASVRIGEDERIASIDYSAAAVVTVTAMAAGDAVPARLSSTLYLDPADARVLEVNDRRSGALLALRRFHDRLLLDEHGMGLAGGIGIAALLALLAGWWRRPGGTARSRLAAAAAAVLLAPVLATGVWLAFPAFFGSLAGEPPAAPAQVALPLPDTALGVDAALARALPLSVGALETIEWPTEARPDWRLVFAGGPVSVADDSPTVAPARARVDEPPPAAGITAWVRRLHGGVATPLWWRVALTLAGLTPLAILIVRSLPRRRSR